MKTITSILLCVAAFLLAPVALSAANETVTGTLTVEQDLLVFQKIEIGEATTGNVVFPTLVVETNSAGGASVVEQTLFGSISLWNWSASDGAQSRKWMTLGNGAVLSLYGEGDAAEPVIVLNASGVTPGITIAGQKVVTEANIGAILASSGGATGRMAIGTGATSSGSSALALGNSAFATGFSATAFGASSYANGSTALALGGGARATGMAATAFSGATATGNCTIALGLTASSLSDYAVALGFGASSNGNYSTAVGYNVKTTQSYQIALGAFNNCLEDAYFMIGNGINNANRSNLFAIMSDGRGIFRSTTFTDLATPTEPQENEALTVEGAATIKGTLRVRPAGDLSMGTFTAGEQP